MDSPFSASTAEAVAPVSAETPQQLGNEPIFVAGPNDSVLADFVAFASRNSQRTLVRLGTEPMSPLQGNRSASVVLFLGQGQAKEERAALDAVVELARTAKVRTICIVGSFRVHVGDPETARAEAEAVAKLQPLVGRLVLFRASHVLSPNCRLDRQLRRWAWLHPLVPSRFASGFIDADQLFTAIEHELCSERKNRKATYTLLGVNRCWKAVLRENASGTVHRALSSVAYVLSWIGIGWLAGHLIDGLAHFFPWMRGWNCSTLYPTSNRELLELYNKYSYRHVKIVGYNNGVVHFGQGYPGKTVVSTIRCNQVARLRGDVGQFDAGVTLRQAIDVVSQGGKEFHVLPNYSYVSVGTSFFIPIHGSASEHSTLGDTIERVLVYDPAEDRFISARRDDPEFGEYIYNLRRDCLLLRLQFQLKDKSVYFCKHTQRVNPTGAELLALLQDTGASNVEIRKGKAAGDTVDVYQYYTSSTGDSTAEELPRDALGKLWDKLEANPITAFLFHGLTRWLAFHVEAFFSPEEFVRFWETHRSLPVLKFQLRYIKRDGLPHSPFLRHDCVSADMFMLRKHKPAFEAYIKENFRAVQFNPGKHSA
jgi:hypothetical protein